YWPPARAWAALLFYWRLARIPGRGGGIAHDVGQRDGEGGARAWLTDGADCAVHGLGEVFDDTEAQPGAAHLARARPVHAVEAFENPWQVAGGDADAVVAHLDKGMPALRPDAHAHLAALGRVLDGVVEQVVEDVVDRILVGP